MSQVLYRTFRPRTFADVVNQLAVKTTLQNAVKSGNIAHAYLFTGPRGVGKTSMARILARAVNCLENADLSPSSKRGGILSTSGEINKVAASQHIAGEPCDKCHICLAISNGNFLDLIEVDAASNTGVDNIREIIEQVRFSPSHGKYKIIVIDEVHMLSKGAFNALLKTLEEAPAHAIFVLATTEIHKVPATIISRTQRFDFKRLSHKDITEQLKKVIKNTKNTFPEKGLELIAAASEGSMRDALSLLDQALSFSITEITVPELEQMLGLAPQESFQKFFEMLAKKNAGQALTFIKSLADEGKDVHRFAYGFLEYCEKVLRVAVAGMDKDGPDIGIDNTEQFLKHSKFLTPAELIFMLELFLAAAQKVRFSVLPHLPLELAAFQFIEGKISTQQKNTAATKQKEQGRVAAETTAEKPIAENTLLSENSGERVDIDKNWNDILTKIREYNHSLISSLKLARVVTASQDSLTMSFPYRFHKEVVEQQKNRIVIEKVLEEVLGRRHKLICLMEHETTDTPGLEKNGARQQRTLVDEAVKVFGIN